MFPTEGSEIHETIPPSKALHDIFSPENTETPSSTALKSNRLTFQAFQQQYHQSKLTEFYDL